MPINKHGSQSRIAASAVDAAFASDDPVFVFPAGLCSRKGPGGIIRDLRWNKMFVNKSAENGRTVIPLRFHGENSKFFYNFAKIRAKSGLKFNIEMLCLPRELFLARGKQFRISILDPIGPELLTPGSKLRPVPTKSEKSLLKINDPANHSRNTGTAYRSRAYSRRFLRNTNKGGNQLYVFDAASCPQTMREVGRLREIAFRAGGGGQALECDIDEFDLMDPPCMQLVVWDPEQTHSRRLPLYADATSDSTGPACRAWPQGTCSSFSEDFVEELPALHH